MKLRRLIILSAFIVVLLAVPAAASVGQSQVPRVTVAPAAGPLFEPITVRGSGFDPADVGPTPSVWLYRADPTTGDELFGSLGQARLTEDGDFELTARVPRLLAVRQSDESRPTTPATYQFVVGPTSGQVPDAFFEVTEGARAENHGPLAIEPTVVVPGQLVDLAGDGFCPGARPVDVVWGDPNEVGPDALALGTTEADADGRIATTVRIPVDASPGDYGISVNDPRADCTLGRGLNGRVSVRRPVRPAAPAEPIAASPTFTG